jgi:uncharacterized damage-inducible protein DinB
MMKESIEACPPDHWDGIIGKYPFWQVVYHTLCFVDLYLTSNEKDFVPRPIHPNGWAEYDDEYPSRRFEQQEMLDYVAICKAKAADSIASETAETLQGPAGFERRNFSRGELYIYNFRHLQHHTGQVSAYLRRTGPEMQDLKVLRWAGSGWR